MNFDQTPVYLDSKRNKTLDEQGKRETIGLKLANSKAKFNFYPRSNISNSIIILFKRINLKITNRYIIIHNKKLKI